MKNTQEQVVREFLSMMAAEFNDVVKPFELVEVPGMDFMLEMAARHNFMLKEIKLLSDGLSDLLQTGALGDAKTRDRLIDQLRGANSAIGTLELAQASLKASNIALSEEVLRLRSEVYMLRKSLTPSLYGNTQQEGN